MKLNETKMRVLPSHICKTLSSTIEQLHSKKLDKLTRILPVVEIKSCITNARTRGSGSILRVTEGILSCHGREDNLVLVKVDTNLEWSGEAAGRGVSGGGGGGSPKVSTHPVITSKYLVHRNVKVNVVSP